MTSVFIQGFLTCAALIIAIGAQNAFVLRQGLKREHVFAVALCCALSDALLVSLGVAGVGILVQQTPMLLALAKYGGAAFLIVYGLFAARRAWKGGTDALSADASDVGREHKNGTANGSTASGSLRRALLACLAFTYLNPHCYLDTVVLMGAISAQYDSNVRPVFAVGAISASFVWFFSLAYGARLLAPLFAKPMAWRILDALIALIMWAIAGTLLAS
jgi:L-lysine exporter family protein LysE/ArgO